MLASHAVRSLAKVAFSLALIVTTSNCGSSTPTDPDPDPDPATIAISIDPSSGTVEQGGSLVVNGTATIGGGFTGNVTFTVTGLPSGVTISVGTVTLSGTTATAPITVTVGAGVDAGTYSGTITASGSGVSDSVTYSLTVTEAAGFSLGSISNVSIQQGMSGTTDVTIARSGGFAESVAIAVEGAPSGVTPTPNPASTTGTSSTIGIAVDGSVGTGTYTLTVRGTSTGFPDATATFDLTVTAAPAGTQITVDYSVCSVDDRPVWVAIQDGMAGNWTPITGVNDVYTFTVTQNVLGFAGAYVSGSESDVSVDYFTTSEAVLAAAGDVCDDSGPTGKTVNGMAANVVGLTNLSLGGGFGVVVFDGAFTIAGVVDGSVDLVGYSMNSGVGSDRMLIRRDQDIADNGSLGTVDFTAEGFDPQSATITVGGLVGGEAGTFGASYATVSSGLSCGIAPLSQDLLSGSTFTLSSAPASEQASDEYHVAAVTTGLGDATRQVQESFSTLADRTVDLPPEIPVPTLTDITGGASYLRLQAAFTLPADFNSLVFFDYYGATTSMTVFATAGVMSGAVTLAMPDFTGLTGWDAAWATPANETGVEYVLAGSGNSGSGLCSDGGRVVNSTRSASYN
ncbi:MAG: hypothetical protein HKN72_11875 [Gemmatimonadetes bacterium]|nr:hypothetical protein [Gemmatimonadota bacterium]